MAELTDVQKLEIVELLACFRDTTTIMAHFQQEYGLELNHKQVGIYDPTRNYYAAGERWLPIFEARRKAYIEDMADLPIANQGFRLRLLQEEALKAFREKKPTLGAALLEQAAREVGGILTNQRTVDINDSRGRARDLDPADREAMMADLIRQAFEQMPKCIEAEAKTIQ